MVVSDGFESSGFDWKTRHCMEVTDCWLNAWEIVEIVDGFLWVGSLLEKYIELVCDCFGGRDVEVGSEADVSV